MTIIKPILTLYQLYINSIVYLWRLRDIPRALLGYFHYALFLVGS